MNFVLRTFGHCWVALPCLVAIAWPDPAQGRRRPSVAARAAPLLAGLGVEVVNAGAGEMPRRSNIVAVDDSVSCTWTIRFASGGPNPLRVSLGTLRYVQGDGTDLDLGVGDVDVILRLGERRSEYDRLLAVISSAAEGCGARLAPPPMLAVPTPPPQ